MIPPAPSLALDSAVNSVLDELHRQSRRELPSLVGYFLLPRDPAMDQLAAAPDIDDWPSRS